MPSRCGRNDSLTGDGGWCTIASLAAAPNSRQGGSVFGPATQAGSVARRFRAGRVPEELDVLPPRTARANRPAIEPSGSDGGEKEPVESVVARRDGFVATIFIKVQGVS